VDVERFLKALPSLSNPYALAGYLVIAIIWFGYALSKARVLSRLSSGQTSTVIRLIFKYAFRLSIVAIIICVGYAGYQAYLDANRNAKTHNSVNQQAGDCSNIQNGNGNSASSNCENKAAGTK
jgi:hypothetical protein